MSKMYYIVNGNTVLDIIPERVGSNTEQVAKTTLDYIVNDFKHNNEWLKPRIEEVDVEGEFVEGQVNIVTTIKMNNEPVKCIIGNYDKIVDIIDSLKNLDDEYRRYSFQTNYIG